MSVAGLPVTSWAVIRVDVPEEGETTYPSREEALIGAVAMSEPGDRVLLHSPECGGRASCHCSPWVIAVPKAGRA